MNIRVWNLSMDQFNSPDFDRKMTVMLMKLSVDGDYL